MVSRQGWRKADQAVPVSMVDSCDDSYSAAHTSTVMREVSRKVLLKYFTAPSASLAER